MRYATSLLALVAFVSLSATAFAADEPAKGAERHNVLHGIVKKVDGKSITVEVGKGDAAKEVVVQTDDTTMFTVDHKPAKLEDIKAGELVAVGPAEGVAHHVDLNTTHKEAGARQGLVHGIVKKVDGNAITVAIGTGDNEKDVVVQTDDKTKFTVDHNPAKIDDVKEGELIAITPAEGVAHHVDLNTTHKKGSD
jgi:ribosomal protein L21E